MLLAEPPANGGYMMAAYVATALLLGGYAAKLLARVQRALREGTRRD